MTTTIDCERETIDFDSIHEYLRDNQLPSRDAAVSMSSNAFNQRQVTQTTPAVEEPRDEVPVHHQVVQQQPQSAGKADELETLWPGVHHDFPQHNVQRSASFYISVGFAAGAVASIVGIIGFFSVQHFATTAKANTDSTKVMVAGVPQTVAPGGTATASGDVLVPSSPTYQVQPGDTLAGIAVRNYKRVSPRLLDEICKANNMRNANVLSLGQKILLPEYRASNQIAATTNSSVQ
jgi:LysM repeat protein